VDHLYGDTGIALDCDSATIRTDDGPLCTAAMKSDSDSCSEILESHLTAMNDGLQCYSDGVGLGLHL